MHSPNERTNVGQGEYILSRSHSLVYYNGLKTCCFCPCSDLDHFLFSVCFASGPFCQKTPIVGGSMVGCPMSGLWCFCFVCLLFVISLNTLSRIDPACLKLKNLHGVVVVFLLCRPPTDRPDNHSIGCHPPHQEIYSVAAGIKKNKYVFTPLFIIIIVHWLFGAFAMIS
jgi:hypothetical protein